MNQLLNLESCTVSAAAAGISLFEVESSTDDQGRIIFRPESLVSVLRAVVENHRGVLAEKQGYHI